MPTLSDLANVLIGCRVTTKARWEKAAQAGGGDLARTLDALAARPPAWWAGKPGDDAPPGLTEYQRDVIEFWFGGGDVNLARQLARNQFLLLDKLGQGGQGEVYRSRQLNPPRFVAVKTLIQDTESGRARFEQEARAMMRIHHPGVAAFHLYERVRDAAGNPTDEYLIAMEFVDGTDLNRLVKWGGPVPWVFAARWAIDLLGGLVVIHQNGFIHRDVKPANVMIVGPTPGPGVAPAATAAKLLDFGAVKQAEAAPTPTGGKPRRVFIGTREYAPPEQWGGHVVAASDIYALGGSLFFALAGRPPYEVETRDPVEFMKKHARSAVPDPREHNPDVPEELSRLVRQMMAKNPANRGTAAELIDEFRQLLPKETAEMPALAPATPARPVRPAPAAGTATYRPAAEPAPEPRSFVYRAVDPVLAVLEGIFIRGHLRPPPGQEPAIRERVAALLRRPLVLVTLVILLGLLIFLLR